MKLKKQNKEAITYLLLGAMAGILSLIFLLNIFGYLYLSSFGGEMVDGEKRYCIQCNGLCQFFFSSNKSQVKEYALELKKSCSGE